MTAIDCLDLYEDAEFYDSEFGERDFEIPFFRKYAAQAKGPVLEVACGTGRITLPIARDGIEIAGIDIAPAMVERARMKSAAAGLAIDWGVQDCRVMNFGQTFALIFSATNAMQHLLDIDSVCAFLKAARKALRSDGCLIIDVFNPDLAKLMRPPTDRYVHKTMTGPNGEPIRVEVASAYRAAAQILHFDLFYYRGDELLRTKQVNMRCFFPEELLALCQFCGFEVVRRVGDYEENRFVSDSPKQILFLRPARVGSE